MSVLIDVYNDIVAALEKIESKAESTDEAESSDD